MTTAGAAAATRRRPSRAFVIGRFRKGRPIADAVHEVGRLLDREGVVAECKVVRRKREVRKETARAVKAGHDLVVCVGGDGAVLQVATSLAGTDVALAIVPTGTGNLLARNLRVPHAPADAVRTAITGRPRQIDLGQLTVGGKRRDFTVACGVGFDADVMGRTDSEQKGRWGKLAYLASAFAASGNIRNVRHDITLDGVRTTTEAAQVIVANFGRLPPGFKVRGIRSDDGLLDVFVVRASGPLPALLAGWEAIRQTAPGESDSGRVMRARARKVRVVTDPERQVEIDGSVVGTTPIRISVRPLALTVMDPRP
jgi:diacylglycerol kinase family enzyme